MAELVRLCDAGQVREGVPLQVMPPDMDPLAVCRVEGKVYVIDDTCTHGLASLSEGDIQEDIIYCPFHGGSFNVITGEAVDLPCTSAVRTYDVVVRDDSIFIAVND